jgi:hypothetical protein
MLASLFNSLKVIIHRFHTFTLINTLNTTTMNTLTTNNNTIDTFTPNFVKGYQNKVITIPRGKNIGRFINNFFVDLGIRDKIDIKTINTERDLVNRSNVATVEYSFKPITLTRVKL